MADTSPLVKQVGATPQPVIYVSEGWPWYVWAMVIVLVLIVIYFVGVMLIVGMFAGVVTSAESLPPETKGSTALKRVQ